MTTIELQLPDEMSQRLGELAAYAGRSREQVLLDIVAGYLAEIAAEDARIDEARAQIARGEVVDAEDADAEMEAMLLSRGVTPEQLAAIKEEVRREHEAFYGVSLCE
jgi:predicted transcriptional regulator